MTTARSLFAALTLGLAVSGCGPSAPAPVDTNPAILGADQLRDRLSYIAESGQTGSGLAGLEEVINTVPDEAKKKSLLADYAKLSQATNANTVKTIAKGMLGKL
jgi:hypothetical protein